MVRHQDEVSQEAELQEKMWQKEQQKAYLQDLDQQRREIQMRSRQSLEDGSLDDKVAVAIQKEMATEAAAREKKRVEDKKSRALNLMEENMREKQKADQELREQTAQEHQLVHTTLRRMQEEDEKKAAAERNVKTKLVNSLQESYAVQTSLAKRQRERERELDKLFTAQQIERTAENEKNRQKVLPSLSRSTLRC